MKKDPKIFLKHILDIIQLKKDVKKILGEL